MQTREYTEQAAPNFNVVVEALGRYTSATGHQPLMLGGWEVEDKAIHPPQPLVEHLMAIPHRLSGYANARDFHAAKRRAAAIFQQNICLNGSPVAPENVAILQNSTQGLLLALAALKERGVRRVVVAAPAYFAAVEACHHLDLALTIIPAADFFSGALDITAIAIAMAEERTALIVTNPAYSLGVEYGWDALRTLFAALPAGVPIVLDETRLGLSWRDEAPWYAANYPANLLVLRSPSKIFLVNGLKTSLTLGSPDLIRAIETLSETLLGSVAGNSEEIALAYLDCWQRWLDELASGDTGPLRRWRRQVVMRMRHNLDCAGERLMNYGFALSPIDSGPYVLAGIASTRHLNLNSVAIARDAGILMMDSSYFFHESDAWQGFRINLCGEQAQLRAALDMLFA